MRKRYVSIWFPYLCTDWLAIKRAGLRTIPFVLAAPDHGRMVITAVSRLAQQEGIQQGMAVADARAVLPALQVINDKPGLDKKLLNGLAAWGIRYTPVTAIDPPDGIILDASGCTHLWGGERQYLTDIYNRLCKAGYGVRLGMAGTIGAAWGIARFGKEKRIAENGDVEIMTALPAAALRLPQPMLMHLQKLGLYEVGSFMHMPRAALRRRFGDEILLRLDQALGNREEWIQPVCPSAEYQERLACLEPIATATGIEIALQRLLETLCGRLQKQEKGLRTIAFKGYRLDGKTVQVEAGTSYASCNPRHLFRLLEPKIASIEPGLGIELFVLEAPVVEPVSSLQQPLWQADTAVKDQSMAELLDRLAGRIGPGRIQRYLPAEHYWPERSARPAATLWEKPAIAWRSDLPRPTRLLPRPELVEVAAPIPDYPPILFRYKNSVHYIKKADGPERIEREWWIEEGVHRDYYCVEDTDGRRYWLFRSGHYKPDQKHEWFIHGFFA